MSEVAGNNEFLGAVANSGNFSESIRIISSDVKEEQKSFEPSPENDSKSSGKYIRDEKLIKEVKDALTNYIGENCVKDTLVRVRDDVAKGYSVRVKIQGDQEIKVCEFLEGNFCKDRKISRFTLVIDNGKNGLTCENGKGVRRYKVQNGPPVLMKINWDVDEKKCTVTIELGVDSLKIINLNAVTKEELSMNNKIRINGKSLVEAVQNVQDLPQSTTPLERVEQKSSVILNAKSPTTPNGSNSRKKYLCDEKLVEEVIATLSNYISKDCIKDVQIRIRDNESKDLAMRVKIQSDKEIKVSEFLDGDLCKNKRISRFTLVNKNGQNGLSCDVNEKGARCYKVQNGPPIVMMINWNTGEKMCTIEIKLDANSLEVISLNGLNDDELTTNQKIRINGKSLVEAVQNVQDSLQSPGRDIEQRSSIVPGIYSETIQQEF